jgi:hypothetical protein
MNSIESRMIFENSIKSLQKAFPGKNILSDFKLTQGYLRLAQLMVLNTGLYTFPVLVNDQGNTLNIERRLNLQDTFVVSELGIFVSTPASAVDTAYRLQTYPNQVLFGAANANALRALYNSGSLSIIVNNTVYTPGWDVLRHLCQPETQQTAALGAGSPDDEIDGSRDGYYPMEPNFNLIGSKNNVIQISMPVGLAAILANSRIEILMRGVLAQNSTVVS